MDIRKLVDLSDTYHRMGGAVQEQLCAVIDGDDPESVNVHALELNIWPWLVQAQEAGVDCGIVYERAEAYVNELEDMRQCMHDESIDASEAYDILGER